MEVHLRCILSNSTNSSRGLVQHSSSNNNKFIRQPNTLFDLSFINSLGPLQINKQIFPYKINVNLLSYSIININKNNNKCSISNSYSNNNSYNNNKARLSLFQSRLFRLLLQIRNIIPMHIEIFQTFLNRKILSNIQIIQLINNNSKSISIPLIKCIINIIPLQLHLKNQIHQLYPSTKNKGE